MNPAKIFKLKGDIDVFTKNHPKFPKFLKAIKQNCIEEGTIIEINVTTQDGKTISSNIKLSDSDKEMFNDLSELLENR